MYTSKPTETLDAFLSELAPSISIDMMSGEKDPTEPTLPQQPLHPALLPNAATYEGFTGRTNPFWCDVGGARCVSHVRPGTLDLLTTRSYSFLGTSGQTLDDIFKYIDSEDRIGIAQQTLEWSHIAPTCPDTLCAFAYASLRLRRAR